ncbi:trypsin-1-like [Achroia grisella]|uniref:trypsin-1-like n=1 Tax=Achroia grisella TaxID=688607 RepID=UPI0027D34223|nr:trypsin-1-like [Achroia grisella]
MLLYIILLNFCLIYLNSASQYFNTNSNDAVVNFEVDMEDSPQIQSRRHRKPNFRVRNDYAVNFDDKQNLRIRGGNISDTTNFPYMAAIIINGRLWCAGAIVDLNWVVTAAHCLNYVLHVSPMKSLGKYVKIRVGSTRPHEGGILVDVVGAVRHPKFEEEPVPHADVALLKLAENLEFSKYVNLIKIYNGMKEPFAQSFIVVSGWGATRGSDTAFRDHTPDLLSARLKVRTRHYCIDAYQLVNGFQFTEDFFCASLRNGTRDACLFDAGAPAVQQNRLMGIMSFGPERCGHEFQPAVFVKAFYFRDFVKSTIASYKTTADLIEAMEEVEPELNPQAITHHPDTEDKAPNDLHAGVGDDVTRPDHRHD